MSQHEAEPFEKKEHAADRQPGNDAGPFPGRRLRNIVESSCRIQRSERPLILLPGRLHHGGENDI